jgi:hypothetical protein
VVAVLPVLVVGLKDPQAFTGAHDQVTPAFVESLATTAVSVVVVPISIEVGGTGLKVTDTGAAVFARLKLAGVDAPETAAVTAYSPIVALAVNTGEAATPRSSVIAVFTPPANVPLAPDAGAVNVTTAPLIGEPPVVTVASRRAENAAPTNVLCPDPLRGAIDEAGDAGALLLTPPHPTSVAIMASVVSNKINWRIFIAPPHPRERVQLHCFSASGLQVWVRRPHCPSTP